VHDGGKLRKALHTHRGRVDAFAQWPASLADLAKEHHASWVVSAHMGALDELMERFGARAKPSDDLSDQALQLVHIVREMMNEGAVESWPRRLKGVPVPTTAVVHRALDSLCADGKAFCLGMFRDGELWTAFVLRRRGYAFDVIAGPDELRPAMGLLSGDWSRDYRHLVRAVEERYAPLSFGVFAEVDRFRELQIDPTPGAWAKAVAVRDVIVWPIPSAVGLALGLDGARFVMKNVQAVTSRVDPFGFFDSMVQTARNRVGDAAGDKDVSKVLGFDPLAALRALLTR